MKKIKLVLTFDYELFLRKSGTIDECLIKPTRLILKNLKKNRISAVFFIDILHLYRLKKSCLNHQYDLVVQNIHEILKEGHMVELHIHPHWLDASFDKENQTWDLSNYSNYQLSSLSNKDASNCFRIGYNLLDKIIKEHNPNYEISFFRAGGLCIQPFKIFEPLLREFKIYNDCSVAPGMFSNSDSHNYDFSNHKRLTPYKFKDNPINEDVFGEFMEFPINTYQVDLSDKIKSKLFYKKSSRNVVFGDGVSMAPKKEKRSFYDKFKK